MTAHRTIPAERCYWANLDTSPLPPARSRKERREQLMYLFEDRLPIALSDVHASFVELGQGRVAACGVATDTVAEARDVGALTLVPDAVPGFLGGVDPGRMNLLTGAWQPIAVRRIKSRWKSTAAVLALAIFLGLGVGLRRRTAMLSERAGDTNRVIDDVYAQVLPPGGTQPPAVRLVSELRTLHRTRTEGVGAQVASDVGGSLVALLAAWPADLETRTEFLSVSEDAVQLRVLVPDNAAAQSFVAAFESVQGWRPTQPRVNQAEGAIRVNLRLEASR